MVFIPEKDGAVANVRIRTTALTFSAKSLLDFYGIMPEKTSLYEIKNDDNMLIIDMKTAKIRKTKQDKDIEQDS